MMSSDLGLVSPDKVIAQAIMSRPKLPDFELPPVIEVALSMQFDALLDLRAIHLGDLWDIFGRSDFPSTEEQPPLPPQFEKAGSSRGLLPPQIQILNVPPLPRYFFISGSGSEIIQIQQDRFVYNWRKREGSDVYPRFEAVEAKFEEYATRLLGYISRKNLGNVRVTQAELTYVNQIQTSGVPGELENVVSVFSGNYTDNFLHDPEEVQLSLRFPMLRNGEFCGRLYVDVRPAASLETAAVLNMVLLARGKPDGNDIKAVRGFFSIAREYIVSGFASITSRQMHLAWGRTDNV
jgi:uncharacterized protein (TIGR04255 family)